MNFEKEEGQNKEEKKIPASESKEEFIKWFSELNKDSGSIAGGKGANLAEIYNLRIPVPPGFVVTAQAYDVFIKNAKIGKKIFEILKDINYENTRELNEKTEQIRELIINAEFPEKMKSEILEAYENLDDRTVNVQGGSALDILKSSTEPIFVAVRSSATTEDLATASFAGQQDSFVNIKGKEELLENIKKCFASLFTSRAVYYRNKKNFGNKEAKLAVVVQKMVDSEKSGVVFSKDPSQKSENTVIEAVWGLGEGLVSGRITPDKYVVSKDLEIKDKKIALKKIAIKRDSSGKKSVIKLREERAKAQVLKEYEMKKLTEIGLKLEKHYNKPQDIEFAIESDEIFIVQTRPVTTLKEKVEIPETEIKGEAILTGLGASPGVASGKIKIIKDLSDLDKIQEGDVLVTGMTNPDMVVTMQKSSAIVTDEGGITAHAAIVSREMGIPCVVGTGDATTKLKEGEIITVDGSSGKIYKGKTAETKKKAVLPVTAQTKTKLKVIVDLPSFAERAAKTRLKEVGLTRIEGIIAESGKHPNYFLKQKKVKDYEDIIFSGVNKIAEYFEELWIRTSDIRSDEFQNLEGAPKEKEPNPMLGMHGIRYSLKYPEILKAELNAMKRVSEKGKTIGILLPQVISPEEVEKVKKILQEINFNDVKLGVMVETPAAVQRIKEICDQGIKFISFGTNDLTQYILALDRGNEQVQNLYDELNPAVLYQLEYVIRVCKRNNVETSICGQAGSKKKMVKFLVEKGIDSISVNADMAKEISDYIEQLEKGEVEGTDEEPRQYHLKKEEEQKEFLPPNISNKEDILGEIKENIEKGVEEFEKITEKIKGEKPEEQESQEEETEVPEEPRKENFENEKTPEELEENKKEISNADNKTDEYYEKKENVEDKKEAQLQEKSAEMKEKLEEKKSEKEITNTEKPNNEAEIQEENTDVEGREKSENKEYTEDEKNSEGEKEETLDVF